MTRLLRKGGVVLLALSIAAISLPADAADELTLKNSVVYLSVSGKYLRDDNTLTETCRRSGTGFLISKSGFVLTARHLFQAQDLAGEDGACGGPGIGLDKLLNVEVVIEARFSNSNGNIANSAPIKAERFTPENNRYATTSDVDAALLWLTETPPDAIPLALCLVEEPTPGDYLVELFGFPWPSQVILKRSGSKSQASEDWRWNLAVPLVEKARGFSGAPVLNANGDVVAMFRGGDLRTSNWYYATPVAQFAELAKQNTGVSVEPCEEVRPFRERVLEKLGRRTADFAGSQASPLFDGVEASFGGESPYRFDMIWSRAGADEVKVSANPPTVDVIVMRKENGQQFPPQEINAKFAEAIARSPRSRQGRKASNQIRDDEWFLLRNKQNYFALVRIVAIGDRQFDPTVEESFVAYDYWILKDKDSVDFSSINNDGAPD